MLSLYLRDKNNIYAELLDCIISVGTTDKTAIYVSIPTLSKDFY